MAAALTLLLIGSLLQGGLGRDFKAVMPNAMTVLRGSCVTIPCSFDIPDDYDIYFENTCRALWKNSQRVVVFNSSDPQKHQNTMNGNFRDKNCTVTLNSIYIRDKYYFRLECDNPLKYDFWEKISITVTGVPPSPTVTPPTQTVKEGDSVKLTCSAPVPCPSHPPTLTWTSGLGDGVETLLENEDKTKVKTSVVTFTASHRHHHGQDFYCKATYSKQDGSTRTATSSPSRVQVSCDPSSPTVTPPTQTVKEGDSVKLTCSAPVPCPSHPPTLTWTSGLGDGVETLLENEDKTKVKTSVVTFTASHRHHHGKDFYCTATYRIHDSTRTATSSPSRVQVSYPPKETTVSVQPSGPVPEGSTVTLTCKSDANPQVSSYTWYRTGDQDTIIGTGAVLNIKAPKGPFFCKAENAVGAQRSNINHIDVQFAPQILPSSVCTRASAQLTCSCRTVGNPTPSLQWYLDELPIMHSDRFGVSTVNLSSVITVNQPWEKEVSTLLCLSNNSLGSVSQRFYIISLQDSESTIRLPVFITTVVVVACAFLVLVCALLFVIRTQKTDRYLSNEVQNAAEEDIYVNTKALTQDVLESAAVSDPNNADSPGKSSENGKEVLYTAVKWKKKKKEEDSVEMHRSDEGKQSEYAEVKFKERSAVKE